MSRVEDQQRFTTGGGWPAARKHVIFDFGAVVFRWEPVELFRQVLPQHTPDEATTRALIDRLFKGYTGTWGQFDAGTIEREAMVPQLVEQSGLSASEVEAVIDAIPPHLEPLPDTLALIDDLHRAGHRLFFLSNMPAPYADHLELHQPVVQRFEDGVFSGRVKMRKPDEDIFQYAIERFGVQAEDCVFLDDHPANIETACRLGIEGVLFTRATEVRPALQSLGLLPG